MALRAGYYGIKRGLKAKLAEIAGAWDTTIASLFPRDEQVVLGARNILPEKYKDGTGKVDGDLTWSVDSNGVVDADGSTGASQSVFWLTDNMSYSKALKLTGCPEDASSTKYCFGGTFVGAEIEKDIPKNTTFSVACVVKANQTVNHIKFEPLLKLATDPSDVFSPPAMTNRELTLSAADQKTTINAIISAATGAADFAAFKSAMGEITPVTRSLNRTASPEDVPEEVIEEKPVTKKTTKKTVKEGE